RHEHVRVVTRIADNRRSLNVSLEVCPIQAEQELRRIVTLVQERMAGWSVAVQTFKVEMRTPGISQVGSIGMGPQDGSVSRYIVRKELPEDRPPRGALSQRVGSVVSCLTVTGTAGASECVQECLIRHKQWKPGKHPAITRWGSGGIDCYSGAC